MSHPRLVAVCGWLGTLLVVGGLSGAALVAADLPELVTAALAVLATLVTVLTAGAVALALAPRPEAAAATGCGACGQTCLKGQLGSGSVASRACSSTS
jgi:hypothetical protein